MKASSERWCYSIWWLLICSFAVLHLFNLSADFPNHSPWFKDLAKYTDEGWYGNAAIRAHLTGSWYLQGDFNPAPVLPAWPFLEWLLFFFTGVSLVAARALAVAFFFASLALSYLLLRDRGPRWVPLLALTLMATSPMLYSFSRLATLEPMEIALTLAALNLAIRLPRFRHPVWTSVAIGLIFALMILTKTSAAFLLPALAWGILQPLWKRPRLAIQCASAAAVSSAAALCLWMILVVRSGMFHDFLTFFVVNKSRMPNALYLPLYMAMIFFNSFQIDRVLIPLATIATLAVVWARNREWASKLLIDPVFGASLCAIAGFLLFMAYDFNDSPRFFTVIAVFSFLALAMEAGALFDAAAAPQQFDSPQSLEPLKASGSPRRPSNRTFAWIVIALATLGSGVSGIQTIRYATHPDYSYITAAHHLTDFIDHHPNSKRLLVSASGDQISLMTRLSARCDPSTKPCRALPDPASTFAAVQPGWYAAWNAIAPSTLQELHTHFSLEQIANFHAFDDPNSRGLVLFKLHPLPAGQVRDPAKQNLQVPLPDDKIYIPILDAESPLPNTKSNSNSELH